MGSGRVNFEFRVLGFWFRVPGFGFREAVPRPRVSKCTVSTPGTRNPEPETRNLKPAHAKPSR